MRQMFSGLIAAFAVVTVSAAPALACGGGLFGGGSCSPCAQTYVNPCGSYAGYGYGYATAPVQPYYIVDQGPSFSGPGNYYPTYQERAVSGFTGYDTGYYGYTGGRYANATTHFYDDGAPAYRGPATYSYRPRTHFRPWRANTGYYGYTPRRSYGYGHRGYGMRHGYGMSRGYGMHHGYGMTRGYGMHRGHGMHHSMRYGAPRYSQAPRGYGHHQPMRRYY